MEITSKVISLKWLHPDSLPVFLLCWVHQPPPVCLPVLTGHYTYRPAHVWVQARWNQRTETCLSTGGFQALDSIFHIFRGVFRNSEGLAYGVNTKQHFTVPTEPMSLSSQSHHVTLLVTWVTQVMSPYCKMGMWSRHMYILPECVYITHVCITRCVYYQKEI